RFIEPIATLPSSAPSSSRSSRTSGLPSTPSTPGRPSAVTSRRSNPYRSAIASGTVRTPSAPRAGWSAATSISRPSGPSSGRRTRAAAASTIAEGRTARSSRSLSKSSIAGPLLRGRERVVAEKVEDLGRGRHRGRALQPGRDDRTGRVGEAHHAFQRPPGEQPVAQRAAEPVSGPEPVEHVDRNRWYLDDFVTRTGQNAFGALLDHGQLDAGGEQRRQP